jgi:hypothetical protein
VRIAAVAEVLAACWSWEDSGWVWDEALTFAELLAGIKGWAGEAADENTADALVSSQTRQGVGQRTGITCDVEGLAATSTGLQDASVWRWRRRSKDEGESSEEDLA